MPENKLLQAIDELPPEFRLAAAVSWMPSSTSLAGWHQDMINRLSGQVADWDGFIALVDRHRIPALAHANLVRFSGTIPVSIMEALQQSCQAAKLYALRHVAEFVRLAGLLEKSGILFLPLKGQVLSQQLYGDPAMRQIKDIDLLVRPQDIEKADRLLAAEGYRLSEAYSGLSPAQARFVVSGFHHHEYHHRQRGIILELHWRCALWNDDDMRYLWDSGTTAMFAGLKCRIMHEDLQFLYLCDHGSAHKWSRLKWLGDVAWSIVNRRVSSWQGVVDLAGRLDLQRGLGQCALLLEQLYDISLPDVLSRLAQEKTSINLACDALAMMKKSNDDINNLGRQAERVRHIFYMKRLRPSLPVVKLIRITLVCMPDYELVRLPDKLSWMYIPLRPVLWFWRNYLRRWMLLQKG